MDERKEYDLEERTFKFAQRVRRFVRQILKDPPNEEDIRQVVRSSGSVGANYIEANEAISKKDFIHRVKICRKEAKESRYWLRLLEVGPNSSLETEQAALIQESQELTNIFGAILRKSGG